MLFAFHLPFSQWAAVSEVCSESRSWFGVYWMEEDLQESHGYGSQCRGSHLTAPHHARRFWLWGGLSLQRSLLLQPFSNIGLLFFQPLENMNA